MTSYFCFIGSNNSKSFKLIFFRRPCLLKNFEHDTSQAYLLLHHLVIFHHCQHHWPLPARHRKGGEESHDNLVQKRWMESQESTEVLTAAHIMMMMMMMMMMMGIGQLIIILSWLHRLRRCDDLCQIYFHFVWSQKIHTWTRTWNWKITPLKGKAQPSFYGIVWGEHV